MGGGGTKVRFPAPSPEETALQKRQLALLTASEAREKEWEPILLSEMGYRRGATGLEEIPWEEQLAAFTPTERQAYDISQLAGERELKALRGELEVDPALERQLGEEEQQLRETLFRQVGTGYETSTPGIQALATQRQRANELRDAMRRGEMTTSESLAQSRRGQLEREQQAFYERSREPTQRQMGLATGYEAPLNRYAQQRGEQFTGRQASMQARMQRMQGIQQGLEAPLKACCFIFIQGEGELTQDVRNYRDLWYRKDCYVANGYRWLATWLVPLMQNFPLVESVVRYTMTKPLTIYARWFWGKNTWGWLLFPFKIWVPIWALMGYLSGYKKEY